MPRINYATKPAAYSSTSSSSEPPPYSGNGNGFYGVDEKAALKKTLKSQESDVAAWQVKPFV
jgi:hypothetical protein